MSNGPTEVGSTKQLFLDDRVVDRLDNVTRSFHRPVRVEGNPILRADRPWEVASNGTYGFGGTVLYDEEDGIFKMWYRVGAQNPKDVDGGSGLDWEEASYKSCYAVSTDGLTWEKPELGQYEFQGSTRNNIIPPAPDGMQFIRRPNLIKDYDEPDPKRRYKMVYMDQIDGRWGLSKGYSADGISWEMNVGPRTFFEPLAAPNGVLFGWDPRLEQYIFYQSSGVRIPADVDGRTVRSNPAIMRSTSADFVDWGDTRPAITRDVDAPPRWDFGHIGVLAGVLYTEDLYVGSIDTCFTHFVEDVPGAQWVEPYSHEHGVHKSEIVISRDGAEWSRVVPHWEFMRPGLYDEWDDVLVGLTTPIVYRDEILIYYTGRNLPCRSQSVKHPHRHRLDEVVDGVQQNGYAIGLAKMRLDGFVSIDGHDPGGRFTTVPMRADGDRLVVNVRAPGRPFGDDARAEEPYGTLRVEVLDPDGRVVEGYSAAECDPFTGDELRHVVTWKGSPDLGRVGGSSFRLRFHLNNAALYSFQLKGDKPGDDMVNLLSPGARGRP